MIDLIALSAAKKHAELLAMGLTSVSVDNTNKSITFTLTADGSQHTIYFDQPSDGVSIIGVEIKNGHLICLMSDGSEIDAGVLPSGSGSGGSIPKPPVGAQSDWNQNDDTQPDYVKNRPFYTGDPVETVLVEETAIPFEHNKQSDFYVGVFRSTFSPIVGETYKVSWDGTVHECICEDFNGLPAIGNFSIPGFGSDSGEPFIIVLEDIGVITIATADTSASHTISISGWTTQVVKIDEKYLPDTVATKSDVEAVESIANDAQSTANNAQSTANAAKTVATNAQTTANNAQSTANNAVKYTASQNLTDAQKQQARMNIGAGTSSFSGNYNDLANKPTIVQGDWDVNNDADMAYIKNRTHYTEINTEAIVEKQILYYKSVKGDENVSSLSYIESGFRNLGIPDTFNIAKGDILKIDRYREPTNSQYPYVDTIYGELTKITGKNGYDYVYYVFGNAYLFKNVTDPVLQIDISSDYDNGITYAGFINFAYYNGELQSNYSTICLMVPQSMVGPNVFDISILSSTIHMLDEKYIPKTVQRVGDDVILSSSTSGSTKKFKITVDDTGTLSATEVT